MRPAAACLVVALALVGCGGDDDGGVETEEASTNDVLACIQDEGLKALATGADESLGITGALRISVPPDNRIEVDFFEEASRAAEYAAGQAAFLGPTGGSSEVVAETAVVGAARTGARRELAQVRGCIG